MYEEDIIACNSSPADSILYASITISCVADENPSITAPIAIRVREFCPATGSVKAIQRIAIIIENCEINIQLRRLPKARVKYGIGNLSTTGAQTNLKEYPSAAQEKNVTADRSTPASRNHNEREENINRIGRPAEKPKNNIVITLGCKKDETDSFHVC